MKMLMLKLCSSKLVEPLVARASVYFLLSLSNETVRDVEMHYFFSTLQIKSKVLVIWGYLEAINLKVICSFHILKGFDLIQ